MARDDPRDAPPAMPPGAPFPFPFAPVVQQVRIAPIGLWSLVFGGFFVILGIGWTLDNLGFVDFDAWNYLPLFFALLGALIIATSYMRRRAMRTLWESQLPPR